jgi:hypothetical protein
VALVAIVGVVIGFRVWLLQEPARVTVEQAVDRYRSTSSDSTSSSSSMVDAPAPGVYVYTTDGRETVDAMGGDSHVYPSVTTVTVSPTECGFRMSWTPVEGRADDTEVCRGGGGLFESGAVNAHEFFRISQVENFMCAPGAWWLPPAGVTTWTADCRSDGGRLTSRVGQVVGVETMSLGTETRAVVHVRFEDTVTGSSTGASVTDLWLDPDTGLPWRQTSTASTGNDTVIGHVTFDERIDMTLQSTTPHV